jgi:hypothetical protein
MDATLLGSFRGPYLEPFSNAPNFLHSLKIFNMARHSAE